ncbi:uncharacterized protein LOC119323355 [Triticum dicoccoides]|uniref:uncharacterized protein LOC119323355 n=1 Tax=Triticum dicoccoides TaxID=85692 RepID=UPI001891DF5A|nr:uncharacterized protein LOC119323355 [Triticum dicoccoides]XP_044412079.1 uncharacterized protein LOC123136677 [Triticum aestivum]
MLPQGDHRRRLVWLLVRLLRLVGWPAASWIQLRYEDGGGIFFPKRASQTHRRYFCVRQLNTSSTSSTAETFFEVRTADGTYWRWSDCSPEPAGVRWKKTMPKCHWLEDVDFEVSFAGER